MTARSGRVVLRASRSGSWATTRLRTIRGTILKTSLARFAADESGATAIEYGIMAALLATMVIAAMAAFTPQFSSAFRTIANDFVTPS